MGLHEKYQQDEILPPSEYEIERNKPIPWSIPN